MYKQSRCHHVHHCIPFEDSKTRRVCANGGGESVEGSLLESFAHKDLWGWEPWRDLQLQLPEPQACMDCCNKLSAIKPGQPSGGAKADSKAHGKDSLRY
jgi:hypothetical protein